MSNAEKIELVLSARDQGIALEPALSAVELSRSSWYYHRNYKVSYESKYEWLRPIVEEIVTEHADYGVPRIWRELRQTYGRRVNHKVIRRLVNLWGLSIRRNVRDPERDGIKSAIRAAGSRADLVNGRGDIGPFEVIITDFTEIKYAGGNRKAKLMPLIDHEVKLVYGWSLEAERSSRGAIKAWDAALETFEQLGIKPEDIIVHQDRDSVYTSFVWLWRLMIKEKVRISYAMNGARGNTVMESFNSSLKRECGSLFIEASDMDELREVVDAQIKYYNHRRIHSSIGYRTPMGYARELRAGQ